MVFNSSQSRKLIESLEKSKNYLIRKSESETSYKELIDQLDSKINFLRKNRKLCVKLVSTSSELVSKLKMQSEGNSSLRSLCNFETVSPVKNIPDIVNNCSAIFAIFRSNQMVTPHHRKFIDLAYKKDIEFFILVEKNSFNTPSQTFTEYLESQASLKGSCFSLPINNFFDLDNRQNIELYYQILIERIAVLQDKFIQHNHTSILNNIECFFDNQNVISWRAIKQIKEDYLQGKEIHNYQQQVLNKTINKINQEKQNKILYIKQKINQSKSEYLNPFLPNSWVFGLQQTIEESEVKLVKEKKDTYLYPIVKTGDHSEYLHSYIINLYQQKINDILESQWSNINYLYNNRGLDGFVSQANRKIEAINILKDSSIEPNRIILGLETFPELNINNIIDFHCLKINSRIVFDYNYTQSTWFRLLMSASIGSTIYLVTKLYFGSGKYIGFFILFVQIINIFTGQSVKKTKLKGHKKELQRIMNNKYQILIRLVVEQITQALIVSLDRKSREYQVKIDVIAQLSQDRLNQIRQDIEQHQSRKKILKQDRDKIKSWFS